MDDESADEGREEPTAAGDTSPSRADVDLVVAACRDQLRVRAENVIHRV